MIFVIDHDRGTCARVEGVGGRIGFDVRVATGGEEALELLAGDRSALAVVEVELPGLNGLTLLGELRARFGDDLPVFLTTAEHDRPLDRTAGFLLGADAYLVKPLDMAELTARIRRVLRRSEASSADGSGDGHKNGDVNLSPREREILTLLADGQTERQIAATLVITPKTVATYIQRLLARLGVHSRARAVAVAYRQGLVEADVRAHASTKLAVAD